MATLGAVLGCGRHLASTVVTGSRQWSSTLLAELRLSTILVLALRAFHCGPRRKKQARCTARVTSHMIGDKADALHEICPPNTREFARAHWPTFESLRGRRTAQRRFGAFPGARGTRGQRLGFASRQGSASFRLDVRGPDHLAPFLGFLR